MIQNSLLGYFFCSLFGYRAFLKQSVNRDLKKRYKRSVLGYCWSMLHPLLMMAVLAVAFSKILGRSIEDYPVFLFIGMLPFQFFASTVTGCLGVISSNVQIIDQIPAPKFIFPASICISNMVNLLLSLVPLFAIMLFFGRSIPPTALLFPIVLLPLFMLTMGVALIFAVANVFFEDTQHLTGIIIQSLYFLSPVLYGPEHLPDWLLKWMFLNPMFDLIEFSRDLFFEGVLPDAVDYGLCFASCTFILVLGLYIFRKAEDKFMYFI